MEEVNTGESWNKKRIIIAVFLLALLVVGGYFIKTRVLGENLQSSKSVEGINILEEKTEPELKINIQDAVREKINSLKNEVSGLDLVEIASSSPQVQKILNDIKSLEQYPTNQLKELCRKICGL